MKKILVGIFGLFFTGGLWAATLPAGYTELEYIESTGTQYINTDIVPTSSLDIDIQFKRTGSVSKGSTVLGARNQGAVGNGLNIGFDTTPGLVIDFFGTTISERWPSGVSFDTNKTYRVTIINKVCTIYTNGTSVATHTFTGSGSTTEKAILFGFANGSILTPTPVNGLEINYAKIGTNTFIPAKRNSDNEIGMYDTVSGTFFTNAGSGTFTAGPVVPENSIKIATTAYNSARFSPVVNDLNTTIATIRSVVTNTINQTAAIADLQATKQTRPDENCPAGKKCLLVETEENGVIVPHWYEIVESPEVQ